MSALARLQEALADVPLTTAITGCTYCWTDADYAALNGPVELMTDALLVAVSYEVSDHLEPFDLVWRRILPRVAPLLDADPDPAQQLSHLRQAEWRTWPERDAVAAWIDAWFERRRHENDLVALAGAAASTGTTMPWLQRLGEGASQDLLLDLLWELTHGGILGEGSLSGFWPEGAEDEIRAWLLQDWVAIAVDAADPEASAALDRLRRG